VIEEEIWRRFDQYGVQQTLIGSINHLFAGFTLDFFGFKYNLRVFRTGLKRLFDFR
jgi:hypothetical protein